MIVDYWIIRKTVLDVADLYRPGAGRYWYTNGFNVRALVAVAIGVVPVIPGFLHAATTKGGVVADPNFLDQLYRYGVFVAFGLAEVSYFVMSLPATREAPATALAE
jgi:NCS1 family nucleobase:cation symporter-1